MLQLLMAEIKSDNARRENNLQAKIEESNVNLRQQMVENNISLESKLEGRMESLDSALLAIRNDVSGLRTETFAKIFQVGKRREDR